jgi:hypothetical protein
LEERENDTQRVQEKREIVCQASLDDPDGSADEDKKNRRKNKRSTHP